MVNKHFVLGFVICACYQGFIQDLLGKEKYMKALEVVWIEWHWSIWAGIGTFILLAEIYLERQEKKVDKLKTKQ